MEKGLFTKNAILACGLAASTLSFAQGNAGGGSGPGGGGTPSGGHFTVQVANTGTGISRTVTSSGIADLPLTTADCHAYISDFVTSTSVQCTGNAHITVTWVPSYVGEVAPSFAYLLLTSEGKYSAREGVTGNITLGLPELGPIGTYPPYKVHSGRKVLRLKIENGSAEYDISGGVGITVQTPAEFMNSNGGHGSWWGNASLNVKAIGLLRALTSRFETETVGLHDRWVIKPYESDDYERQISSVGTIAQYGMVFNAVKNKNEKKITQGYLSSALSLGSIGSWTSSPWQNISFSSSLATLTTSPLTGDCLVYKQYSASEILQMRTTPKTVTVEATTTDPLDAVTGPFKATHEYEVWAPARLLEVIGEFSETSDSMPMTFKDENGDYSVQITELTYVGQTGSLSAQVENFKSTSHSVTHTWGGTGSLGIKEFLEVGVGYDYGKEVGEEAGYNFVTGTSLGIGPCSNPVEEWQLFYTAKWTSEARWMGVKSPITGAIDQDREDTLNTKPIEIRIRAVMVASGLPL